MLRTYTVIPIVAATVLTFGLASSAAEGGDPNDRTPLRANPGHPGFSTGGQFTLSASRADIVPISVGGRFRLSGSGSLKAADNIFDDGFESGNTTMWSSVVPLPVTSGVVAPFDLEECPPGWETYRSLNARRAVVGLMPGGTAGGGVQAWDHVHRPNVTVGTDSSVHNHQWAWLSTGPAWTWRSYTSSADPRIMVAWADGIGDSAGNRFPLIATPPATLFTSNSSHNHSVTLTATIVDYSNPTTPYVYVNFCRKR